MSVVLYVLLFVSIFLFLDGLIAVFTELKKRKYINSFIKNLNEKYEDRLRLKQAKALYEGDTQDKTLIDKVDQLIEQSSIRLFIPITSEIFIVTIVFISSILSILFYETYHIFFLSIFIFIFNIILIIMIMKLMARITYDKIDDQALAYINTLDNLCDSNDDIITIFEKAIPYIREPLKGYSEQFVFECKKGIPVSKAFKNFQDKIESKRFKQLLKNLEISSKHEANYKKVLGKSRIIMRRYFEQKAKRKKAINEGRKELLVTIIMGVFIIYLISGFNPTIKQTLLNTTAGHVILTYNIIVLLIGVYKIITLDKVNY